MMSEMSKMSDNIILSRMGRVPAGFENVLDGYQHIFGSTECSFFSAPGRTEICGNHLDHQHGCVIAAAVGLDIKAAAGMRDDKVVHIYSEGFGEIITDIADTEVREEEYGTVNSLIRGIAAAFKGQGLEVSGFNAYIQSSVPSGSGVSSSAAFEVLIGNIFMEMSKADHEPGDSLPEKRKLADAVNIARAGQYAENRYFGKPSGLMDQLACSVGGIIYMDLKCPDDPEVIPIDAGSCLEGYSICLVNTGSSHADLTGDYASVSEEMHRAASALGQDVLRDVKREDFYSRIPYLRDAAGDRALLRAAHFFDEMDRVKEAAEALKAGDTKYFLSIVNASGDSSFVNFP